MFWVSSAYLQNNLSARMSPCRSPPSRFKRLVLTQGRDSPGAGLIGPALRIPIATCAGTSLPSPSTNSLRSGGFRFWRERQDSNPPTDLALLLADPPRHALVGREVPGRMVGTALRPQGVGRPALDRRLEVCLNVAFGLQCARACRQDSGVR